MNRPATRLGLGLVSLATLFALTPGLAAAALTHRYSFNDGTANDSVGDAHGLPVNGIRIANGQADFVNSGSPGDPLRDQYIDLPDQIARTPALTLEVWATYRGGGLFEEIVSIGTGTAGELRPGTPNPGVVLGTEYVAIIPNLPGLTGTIRSTTNVEQQLRGANPQAMPLRSEHHVAYTVDFPSREAALYLDGVEIGRRAISIDPSLHDQVNNWLGRSQWSLDSFYNGTINEFRIYDTALSPADVAASFARGPDAVPEPSAVAVSLALAGLVLLRRTRGTRG